MGDTEATEGLCFSVALLALLEGESVRRAAWDEGTTLSLVATDPDSDSPYIAISNEDGEIGYWTPTQTNILAEDWIVLP
jgi:Protein of unknown function (DUF2829)